MSDFEIDYTVKVYRSPDGLFIPRRETPTEDGWAIRNKLYWAYTPDGPEMAKRCTSCDQIKLGRDFHYAEKGSAQLASKCRACVKSSGKEGPKLELADLTGEEVLEVDLTVVFARLAEIMTEIRAARADVQVASARLQRVLKELGVEE